MSYDISVDGGMKMDKIIKYKKTIIIIAIFLVISIVSSGFYILNTTLNNINYSKNEAHMIALNHFSGTIVSSKIEYDDLEIIYHLLVRTKDNEMIDLEIDATTGQIISYEYRE